MDKNTYRRYWLERRKTFQAEKIQAFQEALVDFLSGLESQTIFSYFSIEDAYSQDPFYYPHKAPK